MNPNHRLLDQIRRGTLNHRVDRESLSLFPQGSLNSLQIRDGPTPAQQRGRKTIAAHLIDTPINKGSYPRIAQEIQIDETLRLADGQAGGSGESIGGLTINDAEIDGLGTVSLFGGDVLQRYAEDLRSDKSMNVLILSEGVDQGFILTEMRQDPKLNLGIIGG